MSRHRGARPSLPPGEATATVIPFPPGRRDVPVEKPRRDLMGLPTDAPIPLDWLDTIGLAALAAKRGITTRHYKNGATDLLYANGVRIARCVDQAALKRWLMVIITADYLMLQDPQQLALRVTPEESFPWPPPPMPAA